MADIVICRDRTQTHSVSYDAVIDYGLHECNIVALTPLSDCSEWDI